MRTITLSMTALVVTTLVASALLVSACGDGGKAQRAAKIKELEAEAKKLNQEFVVKSEAWSAVKVKVIPARGAWVRSKGTGEEAALKQAYQDIQAEANKAIAEEEAARRAIQKITDEIDRLKMVR